MDCKKCKQSGKVFDDDLDKARLTKINRRLVAAKHIAAGKETRWAVMPAKVIHVKVRGIP